MVVQIKSGKRENGKSFCCNLYRKCSNASEPREVCFAPYRLRAERDSDQVYRVCLTATWQNGKTLQRFSG